MADARVVMAGAPAAGGYHPRKSRVGTEVPPGLARLQAPFGAARIIADRRLIHYSAPARPL